MLILSSLAAQWSATLIVGGTSLAVQLLFARVLGASEYGLYSVATAAAVLAHVVQGGGIRSIVLREAAFGSSGPAPGLADLLARAKSHIVLITVLLVAGLLIAGISARLTGWADSRVFLLVALATTANAPRIFATLISAQLLAIQDYKADSIWQFISRLPPFAAAAAMAAAGGGLASIFLTLAVMQLIVLAPRQTRLGPQSPWFTAGLRIWPPAFGFLALDLATQLYVRQGPLLLYALAVPRHDIGQFSLMLLLTDSFVLLLTPVGVMFLRQVKTTGLMARTTLVFAAKAVALCWGLLLAALGVVHLYGVQLLSAVAGADYAGAAALAPWFLAAAALMVVNTLAGQAMVAYYLEWRYAGCAALIAMVAAACNLRLIDRFGVTGAAMTMVIAEGLLCLALVLMLWAAQRRRKVLPLPPA